MTQNTVNVIRLIRLFSGRSPSPMRGMRGTASSLDWDHSVDTAQSPQGIKTNVTSDSSLDKTEEASWLSGYITAPKLRSGGRGFQSRSDHLARVVFR